MFSKIRNILIGVLTTLISMIAIILYQNPDLFSVLLCGTFIVFIALLVWFIVFYLVFGLETGSDLIDEIKDR